MKVEHKIVAAFVIGFLAVILVGAGTYINARSLLTRNNLVAHTYQVISRLDDLLDSADEMQSGAKGFLLTGRQDYLQPFRTGIDNAGKIIPAVRALTADNPVQQRNLDRLQVSLDRAASGIEAEVEARLAQKSSDPVPAIGIEDKQNMDQVRADISAMKAHENRLLQERDESARMSARQTITNFGVLLVLAVALLGVFYTFIRHDLAVRRRTDAALRESDKKVRAVMDSAPDALLITDEDGKIQLVNAEAERLFGYPRNDFTGRKIDDLLVARAVPTSDEEADEASRLSKNPALRDFQSLGAHFDGVRQDGTTFPIDLSRSAMQIGEEQIRISAVRDRTAQQRAEESLRKFSLDLARSNAELERFAYVASHDLQEPLRMVSSYTQLLSKRYKGKLDASADEFIGYAVDGASRMQKLINDLLALSRVGTQAKVSEPVDTGAILKRVVSDSQMAIEAAGATVVLPPEMPTVLADGTQLGQLFQNLLGNALKFRGDKVPRVEVTAQLQDDGNFWMFSFRDNGIGIEPQYFERIFVIFQRLHSKESYPGTGIGLAICKKIVERLGGRLWVESAVGQGTTFFFTLPAVP